MKSQVIELIRLAEHIIYDASVMCTAQLPDERDLETLRSRTKDEGLSFLTITLPTLGSDLEKALTLGRIDSEHFRSFGKRLKAPAFLQGFFSLIFDCRTGDLKDEPNIDSIRCIRQIAYAFKKIKLPCSTHRNAKAIQKFIQCEQDLETALVQTDLDDFCRISDILWGNVLPGRLRLDDAIPKHGPGATEEHISGNQKYVFLKWHDRLEPYFPLVHNCFPSENGCECDGFENLSVINEDKERPVRIVLVPKTLKGPRIIAIEPVCMQYTQQGLSKALVTVLERHPVTSGHINFRDQETNRKLAISASLSGKYASLDLSSASDRVPLSLALYMFNSVPDFRDAMDACRSRRAMLPSGTEVLLKKFASMGSALCFPVEAMYFYTICVLGLIRKQKLPVTYHTINKLARDVFVYGDDLFVPTDSAEEVIATLQQYYCKVGLDKSFWTGKFRESCGMDAYNGIEVTPTYIRHEHPDSLQQTSELISWVATANLFIKKGYSRTSTHMFNECEKVLGALPNTGETCAGLGKHTLHCVDSILEESEYLDQLTSPKYGYKRNRECQRKALSQGANYMAILEPVDSLRLSKGSRWNYNRQSFEVKAWVAAPVYRKDRIEGYPALLKSLLDLERDSNRVREPATLADHLDKTARHGAVTLKRRWVDPY